jgi:hypothetical protein
MTTHTLTVGPGTLTIGESTGITVFTGQCTSCKLVPTVTKGDPIPVLSGDEVPGDRDEAFSLDGTLLQDFGATGSTTEWLWNHRGETHDFVYAPSAAGGKEITGQLIVEPIEIGGDVKTKPTSDFSMDLVGAPVFSSIG